MLKRDAGEFTKTGAPAQDPVSDHLMDPLQADTGAVGEGLEGVAAQGFSGTPSSMPHLDAIQQSFGSHDLTSLKAYQDKPAQEANDAVGSRGLAMGDSVALKSTDLHTAAHEAAHVVQQRAGAHPKADAGRSSDPLEKHADAVADKVVAGESAEGLLSQVGGGNSSSIVQPKLNYNWDWAEGITRRWKAGAGELWSSIEGPYNETFLPAWNGLKGVEAPEGELKAEWDRMAYFATLDGVQITLEQGGQIEKELLPLLKKTSLLTRIQGFKAAYEKEVAVLKAYSDTKSMGSGSSYKHLKPEFTRLQRRINVLAERPDYKADLAALREGIDTQLQAKDDLVEAMRREQERASLERGQRKAEEAEREAELSRQRESRALVEKEVRAWRGSVSTGMLAKIGDASDLKPFSLVVPKGDVGRLASLAAISGTNSELLALVTAHPVKSALAIMDHPGATASSLKTYLDTVGKQARGPDLLALCSSVQGAIDLLEKCSVAKGLELMALAGEREEAALLALVKLKGDDLAAVKAALDTTSGRQNAPDVLEALSGDDKLSDTDAPTLLGTSGLRGAPKETKKLVQHDKVVQADGLETARELMSENANAADVLFILKSASTTTADALRLAKTAKIRGTGKSVKWILDQNASVDETERLLNHADGTWGERVLKAHKNAPQNIVHVNDSLDNGKAVWAGEASGAPPFQDKRGKPVAEAVVTGNTGPQTEAGLYYHSQGFMNLVTDTRSMLLPKHGQNYTEYDIKPWVDNKRGTRRIVTAAEKFYTSDHYASFGKYA